jgi:RHS repeat-associated protein
VLDLDASGNVNRRRVFGTKFDDLQARRVSNGDVEWYVTDHLGSVRGIFDNSGSVGDQDYDAWGDVIATSLPGDERYGYTGREFDAVTQLQHNRAREYNAKTGRWMSEDPLGLAAGDVNVYRYAYNSPTDPSLSKAIECS